MMKWAPDQEHEEYEPEPVVIDDAICIHETELAILIHAPDGREFWVPKSCVHDDSEVYDAEDNAIGSLAIKRWFALKEGIS
jgi:hypothetical protein